MIVLSVLQVTSGYSQTLAITVVGAAPGRNAANPSRGSQELETNTEVLRTIICVCVFQAGKCASASYPSANTHVRGAVISS